VFSKGEIENHHKVIKMRKCSPSSFRKETNSKIAVNSEGGRLYHDDDGDISSSSGSCERELMRKQSLMARKKKEEWQKDLNFSNDCTEVVVKSGLRGNEQLMPSHNTHEDQHVMGESQASDADSIRGEKRGRRMSSS
jgi:hypothetical protein